MPPLHTREVPGSIPGAPIPGIGLIKTFRVPTRLRCPFLVQARPHVSLKSSGMDALLALVEMPVRLQEKSARRDHGPVLDRMRGAHVNVAVPLLASLGEPALEVAFARAELPDERFEPACVVAGRREEGELGGAGVDLAPERDLLAAVVAPLSCHLPPLAGAYAASAASPSAPTV